MMKIKTITCHDVYNYGASLQAYALMTHLSKEGHDVEIIDYLPEYKQGRYKFIYVPYGSKYYELGKKNMLFRVLYSLRHHRWDIYRTWLRKKTFDMFKQEKLRCTTDCYSNVEQLRENPPIADVYIAGSDQIWNTDMRNGLDAAYYADFGIPQILRLSYAASFGIENVKNEYHDFIRTELLKFNAISVREKSGLSIMKELGIDNGTQVIDPVFLLDKEEWIHFSAEAKRYDVEKGKYILVYDFVKDKRIEDIALQIKRKTGLKIVSYNDYFNIKYADCNINDAGPLEFVNLINNAEYVLANSFHGTAFAIILNKQFYTFSLETQRTSSRMIDLLTAFGLTDRFNVSEVSDFKIDYANINSVKNQIVSHSKKWLAENINK